MMEKAAEGAVAPSFCLPATGGSTVCLEDLRGKVVVLYFYPKDDTPACTHEACGFRDLNEAFSAAGTVIVGVSPDPVQKHEKFAAKHGLPFLLLADESHEVADAYGVWDEKTMYGRTYMGIVRSTFVIDQTGIIRQVYRKVKVKGHMEAVLSFVKQLQEG